MPEEADFAFDLPDSLRISSDRLVKVCKKYSAGCCKYIVFFVAPGDFFCVKHVPSIRRQIDAQSSTMKSKCDNCEGLRDETWTEPPRDQEQDDLS